MDFHSFSRKELQTLCKKNKIPANITNVAMANALGALQHIEGLDELLNPLESDDPQFSEERVTRTPLTSSRTSTRRKPVKEEPESSKVSTRLRSRTRSRVDNDSLNVPATSATPSGKRKAPAVSARRKKETQKPEDETNEVQEKPTDVPKTPVAPSNRTRATGRSTRKKLETPNGTAMQRVYSTRRSMRLLEKNLAYMRLKDNEDMGPVSMDDISDMSNVSKETENSDDTQKVYDARASSHTVSTEESEKIDELEFTSQEKNSESESQSQDSKSELQLGFEEAINTRVNPEVEPREPFEDRESSYERELVNSKEVTSEMRNDTDELEYTTQEKNTGIKLQSQDSKSELQLDLEVATDARASLETEPPEPLEEMQSSYECELHDLNSKRELSFEWKKDRDDLKFTSQEKDTEIESQSKDSKSELQLGLEVATYARASLETEPPEPFEEIQSSNECELLEMKNDTNTVLGCCQYDESDTDLYKSTGKDSNNESVDKGCYSRAGSLFDFENSPRPENKELPDAVHDDALSIELNDDYTAAIPDEDVAGLLPMLSVHNELRPEERDNQEKNKDNEVNVSESDEMHNTELLIDAKDKTDENNLEAGPETSVEPGLSYFCTSFVEQHGNIEYTTDPSIVGSKMLGTKEPGSLEFLSESEGSKEEVEIAIVSDFTVAMCECLEVEKDQNSEHSFADLEGSIPEEIAIAKEESHPADENMKPDSPTNQICLGNVEDKMDLSIGSKMLRTEEPEASEFLFELEESKEDAGKIAIVSDITGALPEFLEVEKDQISEHSFADLEVCLPEETAIAKEEYHPADENEIMKLNSPTNQVCVGDVKDKKDPSIGLMLGTKEPGASELLSELEESKEDVAKIAIASDFTGALPEFLEVGKDQISEHSFADLEVCLPEETAIAKEEYHPADENEIMKLNSPTNQVCVGDVKDKKDPSVGLMLGTKEPGASELLSELEESKEDVAKIAIASDFTGALPVFLEVEEDQNSKHYFADLEVCIPEETAITKEESHPSADEIMKLDSPSNQICVGKVNEVITSIMAVPPICEQKTSEIPETFAYRISLSGDSEPKENKNENQAAEKKENGQKIHKVKENLSIDGFQSKSLRELKKMMRNLRLEDKTSNTDDNSDKKDMEGKRTALQVRPENQIVSGKAQNDN